MPSVNAPTFAPGVPVLRSFCERRAREFYVEFLGMAVEWEHRFTPDLPLYIALSRGGLRLHLTEHYGDATPGSTVFIPVQNIAALQAELAAKGSPFCKPALQEEPWGRQMTLSDPFANKLRFCEQSRSAP
jgi:predicted enzyme related to lactoylglutathione lyase